MVRRPALLIGAMLLMATACGDSTSDTTIAAVLPPVDGVEFFGEVENPYLPWTVGSTWNYEAVDGDQIEIIEVEVLAETRTVNGHDAVVVRDVVTLVGEGLIEDTYDWYLQDADGNVWYVGEATEEYEDGEVVSTAGSWEWGVDGALPGILMYADPSAQVGIAYYQEFFEGEAVDKAQIVRTGDTVTVAAGTFSDVVVIREWNPLEPGVVELKYAAPGVGIVLEEQIEGGSERVELVGYDVKP